MQSETREYQKVIDYVSQMIADGQLKIGDRLPTERQIAETLSIGRNSTREALRMLEHIGMISCKRGSGNYLTDNVSRSVSEMVHMMLLLGQTDQAEICSFRRNMEKAVCRAILDGRFHYLLIQATENRFWIALLEPIADVYRKWIDAALQSANDFVKAQLQAEHQALFHALQNNDYAACEAAIDRHYDYVDAELSKSSK